MQSSAKGYIITETLIVNLEIDIGIEIELMFQTSYSSVLVDHLKAMENYDKHD